VPDPADDLSIETSCPTPPALRSRSLISPIRAGGLAALFKVLANDTRLRLLHAIVRAGEIRVTELATLLGMKPAAVSNQLQRLADTGIIASRREGSNIHYRLVDRCVEGMLEQGWCLIDEADVRSTIARRAACGGASCDND